MIKRKRKVAAGAWDYLRVKPVQEMVPAEVKPVVKVIEPAKLIAIPDAPRVEVIAESQPSNLSDFMHEELRAAKLSTAGSMAVTKPSYPVPPECIPVMNLEKDVAELCAMKHDSRRKSKRLELEEHIPTLMPDLPRKVSLLPFQTLALPKLFRLTFAEHSSNLAIMETGSGKTYIHGFMIRMMQKYNVIPDDRMILFITKPSIILQTERVLCGEFGIKNIFITSYSKFTVSSMAPIWIEWKTEMVDKEPKLVPKWNHYTKPYIAYCDESQCLKNSGSQQHKVIRSFNNPVYADDRKTILQPAPFTNFSSATPYSKPEHMEYFITAVKPVVKTGYGSDRLIDSSNVSEFLRDTCSSVRPACTPKDFSAPAMRKLQDYVEDYTVRLEKVAFKHKSFIRQHIISPTAFEKGVIDNANEEYKEKRRELEEGEISDVRAQMLVAMIMLRKKSELVRAPRMAAGAIEQIKSGKSVIIATCFRETFDMVKECLLNELPEEAIAEIKGGQTPKLRQKHIDRFQADKALVIIVMFAAGGAGLSLHQHKPANKRPRRVILPPVWNAEELVQFLGRGHRVNSDSTTYQFICWYADTIEVEVAASVKKKCGSLKQVVARNDKFMAGFISQTYGSEVMDTSDLSEDEKDEKEMDGQVEFSLDMPVEVDGEEAEREKFAAELVVKAE